LCFNDVKLPHPGGRFQAGKCPMLLGFIAFYGAWWPHFSNVILRFRLKIKVTGMKKPDLLTGWSKELRMRRNDDFTNLFFVPSK
jgi:hypothetical protein